jgi:translocon-associated protein subunit alpha
MIYNSKLIALCLITSLVALSSLSIVHGQEDPVEPDPAAAGSSDDMDTVVTEAPTETGPQPNDDADVTFMFTRPQAEKPYEFPIGKEVHFLVGFKNKGQKDLQVQTIDASFRYSLDFNYILQNFTSYPYNKLIEPNRETTVGYTLFISEQYAARAYGFTVNLLYSDKDGMQYQNTVFNETVTLIELDEGLDSESFFLYIILAGLLALMGYGLNQLYIKYVNPSRRYSVKPKVEQERVTVTKEVDYDWLPPSMVANLKKTSSGAASKKAPAN